MGCVRRIRSRGADNGRADPPRRCPPRYAHGAPLRRRAAAASPRPTASPGGSPASSAAGASSGSACCSTTGSRRCRSTSPARRRGSRASRSTRGSRPPRCGRSCRTAGTKLVVADRAPDLGVDVLPLETLLAERAAGPADEPAVEPQPEDTLLLLATSGTTGRLKLVRHTPGELCGDRRQHPRQPGRPAARTT